MSDQEDWDCPLCMEELDITERNFKPCPCGYQICRFCWHHIKEELNGKCPACRRTYSDENVQFIPMTPSELNRIKAERKAKDRAKKEIEGMSRKHLANVRVVQKSLVYVIGLTAKITEEMLRSSDFFGQYGRITKVVINRRHAQNSTSTHPGQSPTVGVYITYARREDAAKAISSVDGSMYNGRMLRAAYGTTKYCTYYLRNLPCQNPNCMYLHEPGEEADTFTKEDLASGNHSFNDQHQQLEHSPKPPTLNVHSNPSSTPTNGYLPPRKTETPVTIHRSESKSSDHDGGSALPATASWAKIANKPKTSVPKASILSLDHFPPPLSSTNAKPKSKVITIPAKKPAKSEDAKTEVKPDQKSESKQSTVSEVKAPAKRDTEAEVQNGEKDGSKAKTKEDAKQAVKSDTKSSNVVKEELRQPTKVESKAKAKSEVTVDFKDLAKALDKTVESPKDEDKPKGINVDEKTKLVKGASKLQVKPDSSTDPRETSKESNKSETKASGQSKAHTESKASSLDDKGKPQRSVETEAKAKSKKSDTNKAANTSQSESNTGILDGKGNAKENPKSKLEVSLEAVPAASSVTSTAKVDSTPNKKSIPCDNEDPIFDSKNNTRKDSSKSSKSVQTGSGKLSKISDKSKANDESKAQSESKTDSSFETQLPVSIDNVLKDSSELKKDSTEVNEKPVVKPDLPDEKLEDTTHTEKSNVNLIHSTAPVHTPECLDSSVSVETEVELSNSPTEESIYTKEPINPTETDATKQEPSEQISDKSQVENGKEPTILDELAPTNLSSTRTDRKPEEISDVPPIQNVDEAKLDANDEDIKPSSEMTQLPRSDKTPLIPIIHPSFAQGSNSTRPMDIKQSLLGAITEGNQPIHHHPSHELESKYLQDMFSQMRPEQQIYQRNPSGIPLPPGFSDVLSGATPPRPGHFAHSQQGEAFSIKPAENPASQDLLAVLRSGRTSGLGELPVSPESTKSTSGTLKSEVFGQGLTPTQAQRNIAYEQSLARSSEQMAKPKQYSKFGFALSDEESSGPTSGVNHSLGHPMLASSVHNISVPSNYTPYSMNQFRNQSGSNISAMQEGFRALFPNVNVSFNEKTGEPTYGLGHRINEHRVPAGDDWRSNSYLSPHEQHYAPFMGSGQQNPQSPMRNIPGGMAPPGYGMSGVGQQPLGPLSSFGMDSQHPDINRSDVGMIYGQGMQRDIRSPPQHSYLNSVPSWNDPQRRQNNDMNYQEYISRRQDAPHFDMSQSNQHTHRGSTTASDFFSDFLKAAAEKRLNDSQVEQSRGTSLPFEDPAIMTARISEQNPSVYNTQSGQHSLRNMNPQNPNVNLLSAFQNGPQSSMNSVNFAQPSHPLPQHLAAFHQVAPSSLPNDFSPNHPIPPAAFRASQHP